MDLDINNNQIEDCDSSSFVQKVIEASKDIPIIVDFWAPWCAPCKQLTPIIEEVIKENVGKIKLVKINIDENQSLAQQLRIQSVPTILAFFEGKPVNGFAGAKTKEEFQSFCSEVLSVSSHSTNELEQINKIIESAEKNLFEKNLEKAIEEFSSLLGLSLPKKELIKTISGLVRCYIEDKKPEQAKELLENLEDEISSSDEIKKLLKSIEYISNISNDESATDITEVDENTNNLEKRFSIARKLIVKNDYENAVAHLLFILEKNIKWNEGKAKEELLEVFSLLGNNSSITIEARKKLSNLLFK
tara:strand:- start:1108 stop:2016 length:909 start_codon:yes stop_codon:yes gene_type:complete